MSLITHIWTSYILFCKHTHIHTDSVWLPFLKTICFSDWHSALSHSVNNFPNSQGLLQCCGFLLRTWMRRKRTICRFWMMTIKEKSLQMSEKDGRKGRDCKDFIWIVFAQVCVCVCLVCMCVGRGWDWVLQMPVNQCVGFCVCLWN